MLGFLKRKKDKFNPQDLIDAALAKQAERYKKLQSTVLEYNWQPTQSGTPGLSQDGLTADQLELMNGLAADKVLRLTLSATLGDAAYYVENTAIANLIQNSEPYRAKTGDVGTDVHRKRASLMQHGDGQSIP